MKSSLLTLSILFFFFINARAQSTREVSGTIIDSTKLSVPGAIVNDGIVLVYYMPSGGNTYSPLPFNNSSGLSISFDSFGVGYIMLESNQNITNNSAQFRVIVIPGTSLTTLELTHPGIDVNSLSSVTSYLHLSN